MDRRLRSKLRMEAAMNESNTKIVWRQFDRDFKVDAVGLVKGGQRLSDVARQVGVTPKMLSQWRRQLEQHSTPEQAFVGLGNDRESEVKQLKRRIALLETERDILKKPSASLRSQNRDHKDAFWVDFSVPRTESAVAHPGVIPGLERLAQRLCSLLQAAEAGLVGPAQPKSKEFSPRRYCVERHCAFAAYPRRLPTGAFLFRKSSCLR